MQELDFASPYKIVHHPEKILQLKRGENVYPIQVEIHPTLACNHRCVKCITDVVHIRDYQKYNVTHDAPERIPFDKLKSLIEEFKSVGVKTITFSGGGDPLLYPRIHEIMDLTADSGIEFGVITNLAFTLDEALTESLKKAVWIRVSLDAANEEDYKILHKAPTGHFDLVLNNIQKLKKTNFLGINYIVQMENYKRIAAAAQLAKDAGVNYIRFTPVYDESLGKCYLPVWQEIRDAMDASTALQTDDFQVFAFKRRFEELFFNDKSYNTCFIQQLHPILGADQRIYTCCNFPYVKDYVVSDVRERSFEEAWNSAERLAFVKSFDPKKCPSCWYNSQNKFMNYLVAGNPAHVNFV